MQPAPTAPVIWKYSSRARRIILRIDPVRRGVILTLPPGADRAQGLAFLHSQSDWVARLLHALPPSFAQTGHVLLDGQRIPLIADAENLAEARLDREGLHVGPDPERHAPLIRNFLRKRATEELNTTLRRQSARMQLFPSRLTVRDARSRWGSCTRQGRIMLNWRLILAPSFIRDYVAVHELAHLRHFDHGTAFWSLVEEFCPNNRSGRLAAERWLGENGAALLHLA